MKRKLYMVLVMAACIFMGCGTGSVSEKSMNDYAAEADSDTSVISKETQKTSSGETEVTENIKSESPDDTGTAAGGYSGDTEPLADEHSPQGEILLKQAFQSAAGSETELCFVCEDFDGDGTAEAFAITGTDDGIDLNDARIYYIDSEGTVSCIDTIPVIFGYGGITPGMNWVMDAGEAKFLEVGGADGQETGLYGVRDGAAYQPEVSG